MNILICLLTSMICAAGTAVVLVEKRFDWPVRNISIRLRRFLQKHVHRKMHRLLKCSVCTSFWVTGLTDLAVMGLSLANGSFYFLWPFSGFATSGAVWLIYQLLEIFDRRKQTAQVIPPSPPSYDPASLAVELAQAHQEMEADMDVEAAVEKTQM